MSELARELPLRPGESAQAREKRIREAFEPALDADFRVDAPWLGVETDRAFALAAANSIDILFPLVALELTDVDAELSTSGHRALVKGDARASAAQVGDLHAFDLRFQVDLRKASGRWVLMRVALSEPSQPLPEARP